MKKNPTKEKVALVTGSTAGIGKGIALALAEEGFNVILNGRRPESDIQELQESISQLGIMHPPAYVQGSIDDETVRKKILNHITENHGKLDLLVNNAGVAPAVRKDMLEVTEEDLSRLMQINCFAPYLLTSSLVPLMEKSEHTCNIVNISSISAYTASINRAEYCLSKAAVSMMTALFAQRLSESNIRVFEIRPGIIETDMTSAVKEKYDNEIESGLLPISRWGQPEDIAKTILGIVKGYVPYSTGDVLNIDGGFHLRTL